MAGKHEPRSSASFYFSLATATLRAALVVAAVVLGVFVLSKAFTSGDEAEPAGQPGDGITETTPPPTSSPPADGETSAPVDLQGVVVQVLNGTDEQGLAAATAKKLEALGLRIVKIENAAKDYEVTTLFYRPDSRAIARELKRLEFPGARLQSTTNDLAPNVQVTIALGADYAERN